MSATFTSDFRHEFEAERERWLRRRFLWYAGVVIGLAAISLIITVIATLVMTREDVADWWALGVGMASTGFYVAAFVYAYRRLLSRDQTLRLVFWLIVASGALSLITAPYIVRRAIERSSAEARDSETIPDPPDAEAEAEGEAKAEPEASPVRPNRLRTTTNFGPRPPVQIEFDQDERVTPELIDRRVAQAVIWGYGLGSIMLTHFFACLFLPWTPRESIKPLVPLIALNAIIILWYVRLVPVGGPIALALSPVIALPGVAVCWWRQGRFKDRFHFQMLKGRYGEMKQELGYARQIHESLFPLPLRDGPVRYEFRYEPMRQIGGDYLFTKQTKSAHGPLSVLHLAIVDVTGHGIGAALTVNRLHGEFERQFGENPGVCPGEILRGLNSYLHHTLASHSVYATAVCIMVDPNEGRLRWASAGHPPAFLRDVQGRIDRLDSTTFVLGATRGDDFEPNEEHRPFGPGDTLILYTDGAIEARNNAGRMLRIEGMQRIIASARPDADGGWSSAILREVDAFRFGAPQDDTLIVEVWRPVR